MRKKLVWVVGNIIWLKYNFMKELEKKLRNFVTCNTRSKAILLVLFAALLWSTGGLFIKYITWTAIPIAGARSLLAAIVIGFFFPKSYCLKFTKPKVIGAFAYAGMVIFFVSSAKLTTIANTIFLQYTAPLYVALLSFWLLKEPVYKRDWFMIVGVLAGMGLFFIDDLSYGDFWGNIYAIFSGISFAILIISLRKQKDVSPASSVFWGNILTVLIGAFFVTYPLPNWQGFLAILYLGVLQIGFSYVIYINAIKHVTALEGIILPMLEPLFSPIWVLIFMNEVPGFWSIIGAAIVFGVITMYCLEKVRQERKV